MKQCLSLAAGGPVRSLLSQQHHSLRQPSHLQHHCRSLARSSSQTHAQADPKLREFVDYVLRSPEHRHVNEMGSSAVGSIEATHLPANSPCEDQYTVAHCSHSDLYLVGVFDGHAGLQCSEHVAHTLFDYTSLASHKEGTSHSRETVVETDGEATKPRLNTLFTNSSPTRTEDQQQRHQTALHNFIQSLPQRSSDTLNSKHRIQSAFQSLDDDMCSAAKESGQLEDVAVVAAGSCACVAQVKDKHLFVSNLGDSQAILASIAADTGGWTARRLSRSHHVENPAEVKRIRDAHPLKEYDTVLRGGRLLGQLYPLRAFGDVSYKWTADELRTHLGPHFGPDVVPPNLHTPPYLSAQPEVLYHRLTPNDRFLIIASDGLWDFMSPESVVRLLSDHMLGKSTLGPYVPPANATVERVLSDLQLRRTADSRRKPLDDNGATHILRHAIGGSGHVNSQYLKLYASISMPASIARDHRDDITITVVYFDAEYLAYHNQDEDDN